MVSYILGTATLQHEWAGFRLETMASQSIGVKQCLCDIGYPVAGKGVKRLATHL